MEGGDQTLDQLIAERGARPAGDALLVHPLRQPADAAAHRPDARRPVPDRKRQDHHAGDELPFPGKPGAPAQEHEAPGPGGPRARPGRRHDDRARRWWPRTSRCPRFRTRFSTISACFAPLSLLVMATAACAQTASPDTQALQALVTEIRQLRQDMQATTIVTQRVQIVLYRLQTANCPGNACLLASG